MTILGARVFIKSGAEGVLCAALPEAGLGLAVKADDGAGRAAQVMIVALIKRFGDFDGETLARLSASRLAAALRTGMAQRSGACVPRVRWRERPLSLRKDEWPCGRSQSQVPRAPWERRACLRLAALASLALISAAGPSRAADPCADKARAVEALHEGDEYQAAALLFAAARLGCEPRRARSSIAARRSTPRTERARPRLAEPRRRARLRSRRS